VKTRKHNVSPQSHRDHREERDPLTRKVIGAAIEVHKQLGPGLLESAYEKCLSFELETAGLDVRNQVELPVRYKGMKLDTGYRIDLLIPEQLIIELKAVDQLLPVHEAQILTYMKLAKISKGLLINFHTRLLTDGIKRFVL